ncbi:unnamed protein product, partial [Linum tenue]
WLNGVGNSLPRWSWTRQLEIWNTALYCPVKKTQGSKEMAQEVAATNAQAQNQQAAATNAEPQNPIPTPAGDDEEVLELGNLKSDVWKHFTKIKKGELIKAKCNYCKKLLAGLLMFQLRIQVVGWLKFCWTV